MSTTADRSPVKLDARRLTVYLTEEQWIELRTRAARAGETSLSRFIVAGLRLDGPINKEATAL
jgi:hypothetical protein